LSRFLRIRNQSVQKVVIRAKKILLIKIQYGYQKFHADFQSVEKVLKKCTKKKLLTKA
jgi:hypothetical protein